MYGSCITRKLKGGKLRVEGCRQSWRKLVRLLEYGSRYNRFDLDLVLAYSQATKTKGRVLSVALRWGAVAFGIPELEAIGNEPTLLHHVPGKILGAATTPAREQNKAPWISDDIVRFVADLCHDPDDLVKARALFIYLHAICGLREQDVQHTKQAAMEIASHAMQLQMARALEADADSSAMDDAYDDHLDDADLEDIEGDDAAFSSPSHPHL